MGTVEVSNFKINRRDIESVLKRLERFSADTIKKTQKQALRRAARIMLEDARRRAPEDEGELKASFKTKAVQGRSGLEIQVLAKAPHAHLMELGFWLQRKRRGGGKQVIKKVLPHPRGGYMRGALIEKEAEVRAYLAKSLERSVKRLEKKHGFG